jgi:hypothetical protein
MRNVGLDDVQVDIICVDCGTGHYKPIGWFRKHANLICHGCGSEIIVNNEQLQANIVEFSKTMERLRRTRPGKAAESVIDSA